MSQETVITKQELDLLKSNGTVYICRSCRDFKNKIVLLKYSPSKKLGLFEGFCRDCEDAMKSCESCKLKN